MVNLVVAHDALDLSRFEVKLLGVPHDVSLQVGWNLVGHEELPVVIDLLAEAARCALADS